MSQDQFDDHDVRVCAQAVELWSSPSAVVTAVVVRHACGTMMAWLNHYHNAPTVATHIQRCFIGSAFSALPMTPLLEISIEFLTLVEAYRVEFELLGRTVGHSILSGCSVHS